MGMEEELTSCSSRSSNRVRLSLSSSQSLVAALGVGGLVSRVPSLSSGSSNHSSRSSSRTSLRVRSRGSEGVGDVISRRSLR